MIKDDELWQQRNITLLVDPEQDFPFLKLNPSTVFLDNASTTQKPTIVLAKMQTLYSNGCANLGRGAYDLENQLAYKYHHARLVIQNFIQAKSWQEIVFTSGATDSINAVMYAVAHLFQPNDAIILTEIEHTSNTLPWIHLARQRDLTVNFIKVHPDGTLDDICHYLTCHTKLVALSQCSHVLGNEQPVEAIIKKIRAYNKDILILVDGTQAITHLTINVHSMDCDFFVFSGHKLYGPSGTGVLYVKESVQPALQFYRLGGGMINSFAQTQTFAMESFQQQMETGTLNVIGSVCLAEALQYVSTFSLSAIYRFYQQLNYALRYELMHVFSDIHIISHNSTSLMSFYFDQYSSYDIGIMLDAAGICVRTGHLCSYHLTHALHLPPLVRVSFGLYNTLNDISYFIATLKQIIYKLQ